MKGQFVFEFLIAGFIFFGIILYSINYLNTNVNTFEGGFHKDEMTSKAVWVSEMLTSPTSDISLSEGWPVFSLTKISEFESDYCQTQEDFGKLKGKLNMIKRGPFTEIPMTVRIVMTSPALPGERLECDEVSDTRKIEYTTNIRRVGLLNGEYAFLDVYVGGYRQY